MPVEQYRSSWTSCSAIKATCSLTNSQTENLLVKVFVLNLIKALYLRNQWGNFQKFLIYLGMALTILEMSTREQGHYAPPSAVARGIYCFVCLYVPICHCAYVLLYQCEYVPYWLIWFFFHTNSISVIWQQSVKLTTLFLGRLRLRHLTSTECTQLLPVTDRCPS